MTTITDMIKKHPVLTYYIVTFAISWGGILLAVGGLSNIPAAGEPSAMRALLALLALFAGPSISSILSTSLIHGRAGLRELFSRLLQWRVGVRWYAVALLFGPLLGLVVLLTLSLYSPMFLPRIITTDDKVGLLVFGLGWGLIGGGLLEELGWTGFAVPKLRERHSWFATGLIVGVLWGLWHFLITLWMSGDASGALSLTIFLPASIFYGASLPAFRILMVWVYDRTHGSLPVAMLMHAIFSASRLIFNPLGLELVPALIYDFVTAAALWLLVAALVTAASGHLGRQPLHKEMSATSH